MEVIVRAEGGKQGRSESLGTAASFTASAAGMACPGGMATALSGAFALSPWPGLFQLHSVGYKEATGHGG